MDSNEREAFNEIVRDMVESTNSGAMIWKRINPTAYSWTDSGGQILLQQVKKTIRLNAGATREVRGYFIQVLDSTMGQQLAVNSTEEKEAHDILSELYEAIGASFTKKGVDFLKSLVSAAKK